uniref:Uncharacterized protein n=1 Tax=Arundo donax TaxID=35708 RepID=A0A0A9DCA9_ARUDO
MTSVNPFSLSERIKFSALGDNDRSDSSAVLPAATFSIRACSSKRSLISTHCQWNFAG